MWNCVLLVRFALQPCVLLVHIVFTYMLGHHVVPSIELWAWPFIVEATQSSLKITQSRFRLYFPVVHLTVYLGYEVFCIRGTLHWPVAYCFICTFDIALQVELISGIRLLSLSGAQYFDFTPTSLWVLQYSGSWYFCRYMPFSLDFAFPLCIHCCSVHVWLFLTISFLRLCHWCWFASFISQLYLNMTIWLSSLEIAISFVISFMYLVLMLPWDIYIHGCPCILIIKYAFPHYYVVLWGIWPSTLHFLRVLASAITHLIICILDFVVSSALNVILRWDNSSRLCLLVPVALNWDVIVSTANPYIYMILGWQPCLICIWCQHLIPVVCSSMLPPPLY